MEQIASIKEDEHIQFLSSAFNHGFVAATSSKGKSFVQDQDGINHYREVLPTYRHITCIDSLCGRLNNPILKVATGTRTQSSTIALWDCDMDHNQSTIDVHNQSADDVHILKPFMLVKRHKVVNLNFMDRGHMAHVAPITGVSFDDTGKMLGSTSEDHCVKVWNVSRRCGLLKSSVQLPSVPNCIAWRDNIIIVGQESGKLSCIFADRLELHNKPKYNSPIKTIDFITPDKIAIGFESKDRILLCDLRTNLTPRSALTHQAMQHDGGSSIYKVKWHPTIPHYLASGGTDGFLRIFDVRKVLAPELMKYEVGHPMSFDWLNENQLVVGFQNRICC